MSTDPGQGQQRQPTEEEIRAAYESEIKRLRVEDVLVQTVVSLVNLGGRKAGLAEGTEDERDPQQLQMAIDGARALLPVIEPVLGQDAAQVRNALSQLQMAFAQMSGGAAAGGAEQGPGAGAGQTPPAAPGQPEQPGRAQSSGKLWVPGQ